MGNLWYPHFPGDYARDTADLTLMEHGAYRLLLDHYYSTGAPLPGDKQRIFRLCRAFHPEEQEAVCAVLNDFFSLQLDGYHNGRADRQLQEMAEKKEKLKESGRRGAKRRWNGQANGHPNGQANGDLMAKPHPHPHPEPQPNPDPKSEKPPEVGEADMSQKTCDASPSGDTGGVVSISELQEQDEMLECLGHRELKAMQTILSRQLTHRRLSEPIRASFQKRLERVQKLLYGTG